jgi:hypothetical protein
MGSPTSTATCVDECGPVAARRYLPGGTWAVATHRPYYRPDYVSGGYCWAYGALKHRTGEVRIETAETRDTASWLHLLDGLEGIAPSGDVYLILDGLSLHWTLVSEQRSGTGERRRLRLLLPIKGAASAPAQAAPQ